MQQLLNKPGKLSTHPDEVPDLQPKKTLTKTSTNSFTTEDPAAGTQGKPATTALKAERVRLRRF